MVLWYLGVSDNRKYLLFYRKNILREEPGAVPARPGLDLAAHPECCFFQGIPWCVEKEQITGKLVFFGEFGVGKGLQFFFIFLADVGCFV